MKELNFNNKTFSLIENSENGKVNTETIFEYHQAGDLVTAEYYGGTIRYGKIIARLTGSQLDMLYQCITTDNELRAGKAIAEVSVNEHGKIELRLNWEWLGDKKEQGVSQYLEN